MWHQEHTAVLGFGISLSLFAFISMTQLASDSMRQVNQVAAMLICGEF